MPLGKEAVVIASGAPCTVTVTPALGVSRLPLSSTARLLMVSDPAVMGNQV